MAFNSIHIAFIRKSLRAGQSVRAGRMLRGLPVRELPDLIVGLSPAELRQIGQLLFTPDALQEHLAPAQVERIAGELDPRALSLLCGAMRDESLVQLVHSLSDDGAARLLRALPRERRGPLLAHTRGTRRSNLVDRLRRTAGEHRTATGMLVAGSLAALAFSAAAWLA